MAENKFIKYCENDELEEMKKMVNSVDIFYKKSEGFRLACRYGYIDIVKWYIMAKMCIKKHNEYQIYIQQILCDQGFINEEAKWISICMPFEEGFINACEKGNLNVARYLCKLGTDIHAKNNYAFEVACIRGYFKIAKWIYSFDKRIVIDYDYIIKWSTNNGHYDIGMWLKFLKRHNLYETNKYKNEEYQMDIIEWCQKNKEIETIKQLYYSNENKINDDFIKACDNGNIDIVKTLITLSNNKKTTKLMDKLNEKLQIDRKIINEMFRKCCGRGDYEMAKLLFGLGIDNINDGFRWACMNGHLKIAKWLKNVGADISVYDNFALRWSDLKCHYNVNNWLISLEL